MKKITTILMLFMLTCMGAWAQVHVTNTGQNFLMADEVISKAQAGDLYVSIQLHTSSSNNYLNSTACVQSNFDASGATTWKVVPNSGSFSLQNVKTGKYIANAARPVTFTDDLSAATLFTPVAVDNSVGDIASGYVALDKAVRWKLTNGNNWINANGANASTTVLFNSGTGCWTCWWVYEVSFEAAATEEQEAAFAKMDEWLPLIQNQALVTDPSFYTSNALQTNDGQGYAGLLDKNTTTFFHSQYNGTNPGTYHYLQANLSESVDGFYFYSYKRIQNNANRPTEILIQGSNDGENFDDITTVSGSQMVANNDYLSDKISASTGYQYIRFVVKATNTDAKFGDYVFFTYSEFWLLPSNATTDAAINLMTTVSAANKLTVAQIAQINQIDEDLRNTMANVTYIVKDTDGNTLFTSELQQVGKGATITALPAEFQKTLFYTYNNVSVTVDGSMNIEFTATPKADAPFQFTADTSAPVWYNLLISPNDKHYPTYVAEGTPNVTLPTTNADDETTQWAFIGNPYDGFQIVNKAAGTSLVLGSAAAGNNDNNGGNTYATLDAAGSQIYETWTVSASTHATNGFFIANGQDYKLNYRSTANLAYWTGGFGAGSTFVATKVPTPEEKYNALIEQLAYIPFGTGLSQYSLTLAGEDKTEQAGALINDLMKAGYSSENMAAAQQILAGASLNMPKAGQFLRVKSVIGDNAYLKAGNAGETMTFSTTADESNIFCYYDSKLIAYQNGIAVNGIKSMGTVGGEATTFTFKVGLNGTQSTYSLYGGENAVLYSTGTDGSNADWYNTSGLKDNTTFTLEEVTELPITLKEFGGKYYGTFYSPVDISDISGECLVYGIEINENGNAVPVKLNDNGVPAGCGVMLIADNVSGAETAVATVGTYEGSVTDTGLKGIAASETAANQPENRFFFGKKTGEDVLGFFKVKTGGATGGFKACVEKSAGAKEGFELFFGDVTGIDTIGNSQFTIDNGAVYNLQGQRVNKAQKGVYIQNGKKVVLK